MRIVPPDEPTFLVNQYVVDQGRGLDEPSKDGKRKPALDCRNAIAARMPAGKIKQLLLELPIASGILFSRVEPTILEGADGSKAQDSRWCCVLSVKENGVDGIGGLARELSSDAKASEPMVPQKHGRLGVLVPKAGDGRPVLAAVLADDKLLVANDQAIAAAAIERSTGEVGAEGLAHHQQIVLEVLEGATGCLVTTRPPAGVTSDPKVLLMAESASESRVWLDVTFERDRSAEERQIAEWFVSWLEDPKARRVLENTRFVKMGSERVQCVFESRNDDVDYCVTLNMCQLLGFLVGR
jgi:hypothetical protein